MKKVLIIFLILSAVFASLIVFDKIAWGKWNYRITVEIETPEGVKSGSAVRQVSIFKDRLIKGFPESTSSVNIKGEAVVVDLGARGVLFALIDWDSYYELYRAFPKPRGGETTIEGIKYYNKTLKSGMKAELTRDLPMMVTFTDMNDPKSVKLVYNDEVAVLNERGTAYDTKIVDNFEEIFGQGVRLKRVVIEITNDPVTKTRILEVA